ncbi:MAG: response regulator [Elusimicrobia bacterium]|nr:response regulator [Elusimicrobiota bacterium]
MSKHVLVVDDNTASADAFAQLIAFSGKGQFTSEALYGGQACLDRFKRSPKVDLLLLDIDMPAVSGAQVIRELLQMNPVPDLKIIPITAWGHDWADRWHLTDLKNTPGFKRLVLETYDKGEAGVEGFLTLLQEAAKA